MFFEDKISATRSACLIAAIVLSSGCDRRASENSSERRALVVFAASSMTEALGQMEAVFEAANPTIDVQLHFAGSQALRLQIEQGAPADLFVSANKRHADALAEASLTSTPYTFAYNELVVITPEDNPAKLETFAQLGKARSIVIGAREVPVGSYTGELLERSRQDLGEMFFQEVSSKIVSREQNVRLVRAKVELGEADAAIVYRTDALASDRVHMIEIPDNLRVRAAYTVSVVKGQGGEEAPAATAFLQTMRAPAGRQVMARYGFSMESK